MIRALVAAAALAMVSFADTITINSPEDTIYVEVSEHSMNRIVFPAPIISKEYSKEKGLLVKTFENEAFLKYTPQVEETIAVNAPQPVQPGQPQGGGAGGQPQGEKKVVYDKSEPAEVFFVTEGKTYSIIFRPANIGPRTVMINEPLAKKKEVIAYETRDPYKETLKKIAFDVHGGNIPYGYQETDAMARYKANNVEVIREKVYEGTLYRAVKLKVVNKGVRGLSLDERDYIALADGDPLFLSFFYKKQLKELVPMDEASLVIIERGGQQ